MYMKNWLKTIDDYLKMTRRDILTSSGRISHKQAIEKAHAEYDKYKNRPDDTLSPVEKDFIESIGMLEQISDSSKNNINTIIKRRIATTLLSCSILRAKEHYSVICYTFSFCLQTLYRWLHHH